MKRLLDRSKKQRSKENRAKIKPGRAKILEIWDFLEFPEISKNHDVPDPLEKFGPPRKFPEFPDIPWDFKKPH